LIELEQTPDGLILPVQAQPRARRNTIAGEHAGALKVAVTQVPEKGRANQAIQEVLAAQLRLRKSQITLLSGGTSPRKRFLLTDISREDLLARLTAVIDGSS